MPIEVGAPKTTVAKESIANVLLLVGTIDGKPRAPEDYEIIFAWEINDYDGDTIVPGTTKGGRRTTRRFGDLDPSEKIEGVPVGKIMAAVRTLGYSERERQVAADEAAAAKRAEEQAIAERAAKEAEEAAAARASAMAQRHDEAVSEARSQA